MNNFRLTQDILHRAYYEMSLVGLMFSKKHIEDYFEEHEALRSMNR